MCPTPILANATQDGSVALSVVIVWSLFSQPTIADIARSKNRSPLIWSAGYYAATIIGAFIPGAIVGFLATLLLRNGSLFPVCFTIGFILCGIASSLLFAKFLERRKGLLGETSIPKALGAAVPRYYLFQNGAQSGPFAVSDLRRLAVAKKIAPDALYCFEGSSAWQPISKLSKMLHA